MSLFAQIFVVIVGFQLSPARTLTLKGTLMEDSGGPSATSTGEIKMLIGVKPYTFGYQRPYEQRFDSSNCNYPGSIWEVRIRRVPRVADQLKSVRCAGEVDPDAYGGVNVARKFLKSIASSDFPAAYKLTTDDYRAQHSLSEFQKAFSDLDLAFYMQTNEGTCLAVKQIDRAASVQIEAGPDCSIRTRGSYIGPNLLFSTTHIAKSGQWRLASVRRVRFTDF